MDDEELNEILRDATTAIAERYFLLPTHNGASFFRERVYCYELYHQIRLQWTREDFLLNGEVDKAGHVDFDEFQAKPDFLIHSPGHDDNYAIIEVKPVRTRNEDVRKDLETLKWFHDYGYERAILLIYGASPARALARVLGCGGKPEELAVIELWVHEDAGQPAHRVQLPLPQPHQQQQ